MKYSSHSQLSILKSLHVCTFCIKIQRVTQGFMNVYWVRMLANG